jgi:ribonuclease HI
LLHEIYIDGSSRGNPGLSGIGIIAFNENKRIFSYREFIGIKTNNQAEYFALKRALQISNFQTKRILIKSDSILLVNQRSKKYKIRNIELKSMSMEISNLEKIFDAVGYRHIMRNENYDADLQANSAIDDYVKYQKSKVDNGSGEDSELY